MVKARKPASASRKPSNATKGDAQRSPATQSGEVKSLRAGGRTLEEFRPLAPAEAKLLESCREGKEAQISDRRPAKEHGPQNIRAAYLRFMLLGGDDFAPVHENTIKIYGAVITGNLDLNGCTVHSVYFYKCLFVSPLTLVFAKLDMFGFVECYLPGIDGDGSRISGSFVFANGSLCRGAITLRGASIERNLSCIGARIYNKAATCLDCDNIKINGLVSLTAGFRSNGKVAFLGARIGGGFSCQGGMFYNKDGISLSIGNANIGGSVLLSDGFVSVGEIILMHAEIGGDIDLVKSKLINKSEICLSIRSVIARGGLLWRDVERVDGSMVFNSCSVVDLVDDWDSWSKADNICLDGLQYEQISGSDTPTDADTRIKWLRHQRSVEFGAAFWPQPWEHLAKVLREMGHLEDAKRIAIGKQMAMREAGLIGQRPVEGVGPGRKALHRGLNLVHRAVHWTYGVLAGFGYRPLKTVGWMALIWLACGAAFMMGARVGLIGPTNAGIYAQQGLDHCGFGNGGAGTPWTQCAEMPSEYSPFDSFVYSLDVILPLLDLKQENEWRPIVQDAHGAALPAGHALRFLMWFEILFGWITSLLLVSALGKLVQKD